MLQPRHLRAVFNIFYTCIELYLFVYMRIILSLSLFIYLLYLLII